uniref:Uncharacterized protein n=1 Tax=Cacopsylla melanoneura TaxID=428564 RepID=A0A8D8ULB3_9HEMI
MVDVAKKKLDNIMDMVKMRNLIEAQQYGASTWISLFLKNHHAQVSFNQSQKVPHCDFFFKCHHFVIFWFCSKISGIKKSWKQFLNFKTDFSKEENGGHFFKKNHKMGLFWIE